MNATPVARARQCSIYHLSEAVTTTFLHSQRALTSSKSISCESPPHSQETPDTLAGLGMGAEKPRKSASRERIHDHHLRRFWVCMGRRERNASRETLHLLERRG